MKSWSSQLAYYEYWFVKTEVVSMEFGFLELSVLGCHIFEYIFDDSRPCMVEPVTMSRVVEHILIVSTIRCLSVVAELYTAYEI